MFKIGDRVKINDSLHSEYAGKECVIVEVDDKDCFNPYKVYINDKGVEEWLESGEVELIEPVTTSKTETVEDSKFKVGDRVKFIEPNAYLGKEGIVTASSYNLDDYIAVDIHINGSYEMTCPVNWLELIEPVTTSKMKTITPITPKCSFCELNQNLYSLDDYYSVKLDDNGIVELYQSCRLENIFAFDYCPCCGKKLKRFNRED